MSEPVAAKPDTAKTGTRTFRFPDGSTADLGPEDYARAERWASMENDANADDDDGVGLNAWQGLAKMGLDVAPPVGGALGTMLGFTGGAGLTLPAGGAGSIPGALAGGTLGTTAGVAARDLGYDLAGIPMDRSLGARAGRLGMGALEGVAGAGLQGMSMRAAQQLPKLAAPTMKAAVGNAEPGVERLFLKYGVKPTADGAKRAQKLMDAQMGLRQQALDAAEAAGMKFSWRGLRASLASRLVRQQRSDLLSTQGEEALAKALKVLESKVGRGPQVATKIATGGGKKPLVVTGASGAPINTRPVYGPPQPITPKRMEEIKEAAAAEARTLYEARATIRGSSPSPMELAYKEIADQARRELAKIPGVKSANATYKELREVAKAARGSAKRSSGTSTAASVISGVGSGATTGAALAFAGHNPAWMLAGLPIGAVIGGATKAATQPSSLAGLAQTLNNPELMARLATLSGYGSRLPEAAVSAAGGFSPYDPSKEAKP